MSRPIYNLRKFLAAPIMLCSLIMFAESEDNSGTRHYELSELVVSANKDFFKITGPNKFSYEVDKDSTLKNANTIEALRNVPILDTKPNGEISAMNGRKLSFKLNGLHDTMLTDISQALTAIPASVIKKIEFSTDFGSDGSEMIVVNIVTKARLEGYRAQITSDITDSKWKNGIWAMTKLKRLAVHGSYFNTWIWGHSSTSGSDETRADSPGFYHYEMRSEDKGYRTDLHNFELGASYDVADNAYIGVYGSAMFKSDPRSSSFSATNISDINGKPVVSFTNRHVERMKDSEYQIAVKFEKNYSGRHPGSLNLGYQFYTRPYGSTSYKTYDITENNNDANLDFLDLNSSCLKYNKDYITNTLAGEWERRISRNILLTASGKFRTRRESYDNNLILQNSSGLTDGQSELSETSLTEELGILTPKFAYFTNVWEIRGGALLQGYHHKIKSSEPIEINNNRFIVNPFISAAIITKRKLLFELSYNQNSLIPDITALDPYTDRTLAGEIRYGNPFLKPESHHSIKLDAGKKTGKLYTSGSINAGYAKDLILAYQFLESGIIHNTFGNIANRRNIGISGYTSGRLHRNTYLRVNATIDWLQYRSALAGIGNCGWQGGISAKLEQELPWGLTLGTSAAYRSRPVLLQGKGAHSFSYNVSLYKQFFNRRLSIFLDAESFIPVWYRQTQESFANQYSATTWMRTFHASFSLTLRYSFGALRAEVKQSSLSLDSDDVKQTYTE